MATLSAGNLVSLRTAIGRSSIYLSVFQPVTLLTALVNNGSATRGMRSVVYDTGSGSGFATIEAGQVLEVDTADGLKWVRVKAISGNQTAGTLTLAENAIDWADNLAIRVLHFYPIVGIPPTIRSGVFYKDFDVAYSTQNNTPNPVAIIGSHRVGTLSAGTIAFALNSSSSYAIANGASISSRVWSCVHNGGGTTGISFSSTTAANPTLTITEAGQYWLKCIVTDSNSKTQATYRAIWVFDSSTLPYKDFTVSGLSGDWQTGGYRFNAQVTGDVELTDFPDRTLVVLWYDNTFNGAAGYVDLWGTDAQNVICAGYLRKDQDNDELSPKGTGNVSFEVTTPEAVMDACSLLGSVSLNSVTTTPATWYQYASWMTVGRAIHHLLKWHSTVLETCDVYGLTTNTLGVENTDFTEQSLLQMVNGLGYSRGHFAKLVSDRRGRLHFVTDSQMLNDAARGALDTVFTLAVADISGVVDVVRQEEEVVSVVDLDGFYFSGSAALPWIAIAPGYIETTSFNMPEFRGSGGMSIKNQVLNSTQTDSNEKAGRVLAQANNNPFEIRFNTPYNGLGAFDIVPSIGWYSWGIANSVLKRGTSLNGRKLLCRHVDHAINVELGTIQTSVVFEPEALGPDGIAGNYPKSYPVPKLRPPSSGCDLDKGDSLTFSTSSTQSNVCALSATKAIGITAAGAYVLDISGTTITAGVVSAFDAGISGSPAVAALSTTKAIVVYRRSADNFAYACILDVSGSTITPGTPVQFDGTGTTGPFDVVALSATKAIAVWDQSTADQEKAIILDVAGTVITPGTAAIFQATTQVSSIKVVALSATKALALASDQIPGRDLYACVLDVAVSTITPGTPLSITTTALESGIALIALSSTTAYIAYKIAAGNAVGQVLSVAGAVVSAGVAANITASGDSGLTAAMWSDNKIIHFIRDTAGPNAYARTASVSSFTVVPNNDEYTMSGLNVGGYWNMAQLTTRKAIVVIENGAISDSDAFILSCD